VKNLTNIFLSGKVDKDIAVFSEIFKNDKMLRIRTCNLGDSNRKIAFIFFDGMIDSITLNESLIKSCITTKNVPANADINYILSKVLFTGEIKRSDRFDNMISSMENGDTAVILDGCTTGLIVDTKGWRTRGIEEPSDERVLQGPREGFDESALMNVAMIRRKLQTDDLCVEEMNIGSKSNTKIYICYLNSVAKEDVLKELKQRLEKIKIDGILDSNYIAEYIKDNRFSLFKTTGSTERPDTVAGRLLEGRVAIVVDGTPVVLTVPYLFCENFQSDEDYFVNFYVASLGRALRYISFFVSISIPAIFVSLCTFHIQLLPTPFMLTVTQQRNGVPFSSAAECLILIFMFAILKETGLRTPKSLGSALNIVGGIVIGQAAVEAKIISAAMLIVVSFAGVAGLMVPRLKGAVFYIRLFLVFAASFIGLYGVTAVLIALAFSLFNTKSFGEDYTFSLKNPSFSKLKDTIIRVPWTKMHCNDTTCKINIEGISDD